MNDHGRTILRLLPLVVLLAAGGAGLAGRTTAALLGVALGFAALVVVEVVLRRPPAPVPEPGPAEVTELRERRDQDGEVAAVKQLRENHPGLSLGDAARLVREL